MMRRRGVRIPRRKAPGARPTDGGKVAAAHQNNGTPAVVKRLAVINEATPQQMARVALEDEASPDEIVPTAEGFSLFRGERARAHKRSGADKSLLEERLDRIKKTRQPEDL